MTSPGIPAGAATAPRTVSAAQPGEACAFHRHDPAACPGALPGCCGCGAPAMVVLEIVTADAVVRVAFCAGHRYAARELASG